jgi:Zn-dependent protease
MLAGAQRAGKLKKKLRGKTASLVLPLEVEVENFMNMTQALTAPSFQLGGKLLFFGLSMVLFVGAFSIYLSLKIALMLLLILLLHEGGHLLAMRLTGHTNLSMLFIPLFGGVAMGSPRKVPPYKKIIALFAGPLPGVILAAIGLQLVLQSGFPFKQLHPDLLMALILLAVINYFNLIPIQPLDGGQIFNLIIFSRLAFLQAAFTVLSIVGLVILGVLLQAPLLFLLAVVVMLGFRQNLRQRRLFEKVKTMTANQPQQTEQETVAAIFKEMQKPSFANMSFAKKFSMARYVDDQLFSLSASLGTTIATLAVYTIAFLLPVYFYYGTPLHLFLSGKDICLEARRIQMPAGEYVAAERFLLQKNKKFSAELFPIPRLCFSPNPAAFSKNESVLVIGRLWRLFGAPLKALNGYFYPILDRQSGLEFQVSMEYVMPNYAVPFLSLEKSLPILLRFGKMLNTIKPADFQLEFKSFGTTIRLGCQNGQPFWDAPQAEEKEE